MLLREFRPVRRFSRLVTCSEIQRHALTRCCCLAKDRGVARLRSKNRRPSLREDISNEKLSEQARRVNGAKFLWLDPAWIDELGAIRDIIKKAFDDHGKGK